MNQFYVLFFRQSLSSSSLTIIYWVLGGDSYLWEKALWYKNNINCFHHTCCEYFPQPVCYWPFDVGWSFSFSTHAFTLWSHHDSPSLFLKNQTHLLSTYQLDTRLGSPHMLLFKAIYLITVCLALIFLSIPGGSSIVAYLCSSSPTSLFLLHFLCWFPLLFQPLNNK